jgi:hypothetical protein
MGTPKAVPDGLSAGDLAPGWVKFEGMYNTSDQPDLLKSAQVLNGGSYVNPGGLGPYTGTTTASNNGLGLGFELGLLLDSHNGLALGARYLQNNLYLSNLTYPEGPSNPDSEGVTILPTMIPITLDYYFFLPDAGGRFFLTGGVGYYFANVRVNQNTTSFNLFGSNNTAPDIWSGNLTSGALGFQFGLGRDFALGPRFGLTVFVRGRYAHISNLQGRLLDSDAVSGQFGLAANSQGVVDVDRTSNITGANGEHYATIDFTGFEAGLALNFYHF